MKLLYLVLLLTFLVWANWRFLGLDRLTRRVGRRGFGRGGRSEAARRRRRDPPPPQELGAGGEAAGEGKGEGKGNGPPRRFRPPRSGRRR